MYSLKQFCLFVALGIMSACQPVQLTSFAVTLPSTQNTPVAVIATNTREVTAVPTARPAASRTPTLPPSATFTPSKTPTPTLTPTITPSPTMTLSPTITLTTTPIASPTPTDPANDPNYTPPPSWTPPPLNPAVVLNDHYMFARPIPSHAVDWVARTYPYGSTAGGQLQVHHGVDMVNPSGTLVLAAANGTVFYAGDDLTTRFGPINNYYGNLVVLQHGTTADGQPIFTLYGHMQGVDVAAGQTVNRGDRLGVVGGTGVALGPHLHLEVRIGDPYSFEATRNPELWMYPYQGFGTLAGRVIDSSGGVLFEAPIEVRGVPNDNFVRYATSYAQSTVNSDPVFNENFVLGDLPAGYYEVSVRANGRLRFQEIIYLYPNRTTWVDITLN